MGVPRQVEASAQRAADLHMKLVGDPAKAAAAEANPSGQTERPDQASQTAEKQGEPVSQETKGPDAAGTVHDWKERFANLTQTHQAVKSELTRLQAEAAKREADLTERLARLEEQARAAQTSAVVDRSYLSEDDLALLGEDNLAVVEKVAGRMVERYVAEIEERRKREDELRRARDAQQRAEAEKASTFKARLAKAVPDFASIDTDPNFIQWMRGADPLTGDTRFELLRRSTVVDDVGRAASFYNEYAAQKRGQPDPRERLVEPKPAAPRPPPKERQGKIWTRDEIRGFYKQKAMGRFDRDPAKASAIESDIIAAGRENRIRG